MNLDIIGKLYDIDNTDPDNPVVTELIGWHVNSTELLPELEAHRVEPVTPRRAFMGVDTYCYQFTDEQQAEESLRG